MSLKTELQAELDALTAAGTYKHLNYLESPQGARVRMEGRGEVIVLSSNNYLGLATTSAGTAAGVGDWLNGATGTTSSCVLTTAGYQPITTAVGLGLAVTSPATPTGSSGGFDIFYKVYSSAGTPTVGQVTVIFEYVPDDDM